MIVFSKTPSRSCCFLQLLTVASWKLLQVAADPADRFDYLLSAQHYATTMLTTAIQSAAAALKASSSSSSAALASIPATPAQGATAATTAAVAAGPAGPGKASKGAPATAAGKADAAVTAGSAAAIATSQQSSGGTLPTADLSKSSLIAPTAAMRPVVGSTEAPSDLLGWAFWAPAPELAAKLAGDTGVGGLAPGGLGVPSEVPLSCCKLLLEGLTSLGMLLHGLPVAQLMRLLGSVSLRNEVRAGLIGQRF